MTDTPSNAQQPVDIGQLQEKLAEDVTRWRDDPVAFVQEMFGVEPDVWQAEALRALVTNDRVAIKSGHGVGKTAFLSWSILWWLLTRYPVKVACTANTSSQLKTILWAELGKWARKMPQYWQEQLEVGSEMIKLVGAEESFAVARTSRKENPEALQGFHSEHMLFVIDEASGVDDIIFEVAEGAMSTEGAKTLMVGNPNNPTGYFADAFGRDAVDWWSRTVSSIEAKQASDTYIERMARKYGIESNIYRVRVLGQFPESADNTIIPYSLVVEATDRDVDPVEAKPVWGVDIARFGDDRSALCKRRKNALMEPISSWGKRDLMGTVGKIVAEFKATPAVDRPAEIMIDEIGLGAGVVDRLREVVQEQALKVEIRGVNVSESPILENSDCNKLRDELWFEAKDWFTKRACRIPNQEELIAELTSVRYDYTSSGKLKVETKAEMKKRGLRSPDLADAFMLTFASSAAKAAGNSGFNDTYTDYDDEEDWAV